MFSNGVLRSLLAILNTGVGFTDCGPHCVVICLSCFWGSCNVSIFRSSRSGWEDSLEGSSSLLPRGYGIGCRWSGSWSERRRVWRASCSVPLDSYFQEWPAFTCPCYSLVWSPRSYPFHSEKKTQTRCFQFLNFVCVEVREGGVVYRLNWVIF